MGPERQDKRRRGKSAWRRSTLGLVDNRTDKGREWCGWNGLAWIGLDCKGEVLWAIGHREEWVGQRCGLGASCCGLGEIPQSINHQSPADAPHESKPAR